MHNQSMRNLQCIYCRPASLLLTSIIGVQLIYSF